MYQEKNDILNKGVPIELPNVVDTDIYMLLDYAIDREKVEKEINSFSNHMLNYMDTLLSHKSHRKLPFRSNFIIVYQNKTKSNELVFDSKYILWDIVRFLNISNKDASEELVRKKISQLSSITTDGKLEKKFPKLYEVYLEELEFNKEMEDYLKKHKGNIQSLKNSVIGHNEKSDIYIEDSLKITNVKSFCKIYSSILKDILDHFKEYDRYFLTHPFDIYRNNSFIGDTLEADIAMRYIEEINSCDKLEDKQKYLYYLTTYFNENRNWIHSDIGFRIQDKMVMFDDLYNSYIDILVENPGLKVVNYDRSEFDNFTPEEVEEYMKLELEDAKANWTFLEGGLQEERAARAIYNGIKQIKDKEKYEKTKEELRNLYMEKKELFDTTFHYRTVEGKNTFDGYIAFIYPNGKVILERFFEKRKDNLEVIAKDQAIYVMNIDEFYSLTNLSKSTIIRDKLCKRYIHKGNWKDKILKEIKEKGKLPDEEYKKLVYSNKIVDSIN